MRQRREADLNEKPSKEVAASPAPSANAWERTVLRILLWGGALVPLAVSFAGDDHFRLPKQLLLYAVAISSGTVALMAMVLRRFDQSAARKSELRVPLSLAAGGFLWGIVTTVVSTHRALSAEALLWGSSLLIVFVLGALLVRHVRLAVVALAVLLPAIVNATVVLLQASHVWNPWVFPAGTNPRLMKNALLGNPDIVGVYLATAALFAGALALAGQGRRRVVSVAIALYLALGVLASETLTSIAALGAATLALFICWRARTGAVIASADLIITSIILVVYPPTQRRILTIAQNTRDGRWDHVITGRVVPFATAWQMFLDRPLVGVGPGTFKFHYMDYRVRTREQKAHLFADSVMRAVNFGETHSDHLQTLAEVGLPGYLLLLAGIAFLASRSWHRPPAEDERHRLAALLAAPLALFLAVTMLAQFPLQVAAPAFTVALLAAVCIGWSVADVA